MIYMCKLKNIECRNAAKQNMISNESGEDYDFNHSLFQVLLFILAESLEQKP
jgi:hypothetical protein